MSGYNSRAIYRFKQRHISLLDSPSLVLRSTYTRVLGSLRIRTIATVHIALFAVRFPPLFSLCRTTLPDEAGSGLTPQSAANADSLRKRSGLSPATDNNVAAVCGPTPNCFRSRFADVLVSDSSVLFSSFSSESKYNQRFASTRSVSAKIFKEPELPKLRTRIQACAHCLALEFHSLARTSSGAETNNARN